MACQIRYTQNALASLSEILDYSWDEYPSSTASFGDALFDHLDLLREFPYLGSLVPNRPGVRRLVHSPILIYYQVLDGAEAVEILEFRHSSRQG